MSKVGLSDDLIVSKIRGEARPPKISADDLIALKSASVSDRVLWVWSVPPPIAYPPSMTLRIGRLRGMKRRPNSGHTCSHMALPK